LPPTFVVAPHGAPSTGTASSLTFSFEAGATAKPRVMITDKLPSHGAARKDMASKLEHRQHQGPTNRAENAHRPTRRRERILKRFESSRRAQRFSSIRDRRANSFRLPRKEHQTATDRRAHRAEAIGARRKTTGVAMAA